jgi:hypothetical protein
MKRRRGETSCDFTAASLFPEAPQQNNAPFSLTLTGSANFCAIVHLFCKFAASLLGTQYDAQAFHLARIVPELSG